jgi:hypothetical protein
MRCAGLYSTHGGMRNEFKILAEKLERTRPLTIHRRNIKMCLKAIGQENGDWVHHKIFIFWDITPCGLLKINRHFGREYDHNLQGRK